MLFLVSCLVILVVFSCKIFKCYPHPHTLIAFHFLELLISLLIRGICGHSGLAVDLNPIEEKMMDSGSWFWNYQINGTHIHLELVEF